MFPVLYVLLRSTGVAGSLTFFFFFFKQKTAYEMRISDWSSDVCSSDLVPEAAVHLLDASDGTAERCRYVHWDASTGYGDSESFVGWRLADVRDPHYRAAVLAAYGRTVAGRRHSASLDRKSTRLNSSH